MNSTHPDTSPPGASPTGPADLRPRPGTGTGRGWTVILALFVATVGGAWAWFHLAPPKNREVLRFEVRRQLPDWEFHPQPVGAAAEAILATTNLFNGAFESTNRAPVIVFAAEWDGDDPRQRTALPHTPDICWVGAGWQPVDAGQPRQITLPIAGRDLPFQCRVFATPTGHRELVLWCSIYGGKPVEDAERWTPEGGTAEERKARNLDQQRLSALRHFWRAVRDRDGAARFKQFVRFSVSVGSDWQEGLARLRDFAPDWLDLSVQPVAKSGG
ncbi:MAG: exosortase-associated EpsI family protein [Limisphaerales bacterium]